MNRSLFFELCSDVAEAIEDAVSELAGKPEAGEVLRIGADGTPTERIDEVAENAALQVIEESGISIKVVSEEMGEKVIGVKPEFTLVLDPVDGTFNAVHNIPFFAVPVAIGRDNLSDISYGYVKNLVNKDIYTAEKGKGAFLNGKRIQVSSRSKLPELSIISYSHRYHTIAINNHHVRRVRVFGCAALELCYVAQGIFDSFIDLRGMLRVTDIAAAKLIVEEAGGRVTDGKGEELFTKLDVRQRVNMIASNGLMHKKLLELV